MSESKKVPQSVLIACCIIVGIIVFLVTRYTHKTNDAPKEIKQQIDTLTKKRDSEINQAVEQSAAQVKKSDSLYRSIPTGVYLVPETSTDTMFEYVRTYKYTP